MPHLRGCISYKLGKKSYAYHHVKIHYNKNKTAKAVKEKNMKSTAFDNGYDGIQTK